MSIPGRRCPVWRRCVLTALSLVALLDVHAAGDAPPLTATNVFVSGEGGYNTYRIPSLLVTARGTLLAFAEGRKAGRGDSGDIDLVLKRSYDGGRTWTPAQVVWDEGPNTCGNPCPVLDRDTGTIWLPLTWNRGDDPEPKIIAQQSRDTRRVFVTRSADDGRTWSEPREITADVKPTNWTWYATGPGAGIQIEHGPHRGRLVIPCDHIEAVTRHYYSHVIYSDDHGQSWRLGGSTPQPQVNECEVVELTGGRLLLNMRNYDRSQLTRQQAVSSDGGLTWTDQRHVPELIEPICQASIRRLSWPTDRRGDILLFANPASTKRERLTVRASHDQGKTWPVSRVLDPRPSAYSCLAILPDHSVGILYEAGEQNPYETIVFARFPIEWLTPHWDWDELASLPDPEGFAGAYAGVSDGSLIVAGGANFPDRKPWEGGRKVWHDAVFALAKPEGSWRVAGRLPRPLAYGVSVTTPAGMICVGGSDAERHFAETFQLSLSNGVVQTRSLAALPIPLAHSAGALLGDTLYVCGGSEQPGEQSASSRLFALNVSKPGVGWKELEACPGPPRILPVAAGIGGVFYLAGGAAIETSDGRSMRVYLRDAWRYRPGGGWEAIADLQEPVAAAASPAPVFDSRFLVVGGDDGALVGTTPLDRHPGFPAKVRFYDVDRREWGRAEDAPFGSVTLPTVFWHGRFVLPGGEVQPGVRTPKVWTLGMQR